jgi:hypothetical protein
MVLSFAQHHKVKVAANKPNSCALSEETAEQRAQRKPIHRQPKQVWKLPDSAQASAAQDWHFRRSQSSSTSSNTLQLTAKPQLAGRPHSLFCQQPPLARQQPACHPHPPNPIRAQHSPHNRHRQRFFGQEMLEALRIVKDAAKLRGKSVRQTFNPTAGRTG